MEGREDASFVTGMAIMLGSVLIEGIHLGMITTTTTTIFRATTIKGMVDSTTKEKGMTRYSTWKWSTPQKIKKLQV